MKLSIISDLHIQSPEDPFYKSLLRVIGKASGEDEVVVLAGDIFDLFVGGKAFFLRRYSDFFWTVRSALGRGVQIHYIEGNHDFQIQDAFRGMEGLFVHAQDVSLQLGEARFYVAHGDLVDGSDTGYLLLRRFFRSMPMRVFVRCAPGSFLDLIGKASSRRSRKRRQNAQRSQYPETDRQSAFHLFACERIREGYDFVVLGHSHNQDESGLAVDGRKGRYYNVGYPRVSGTYLVWRAGENALRREPLPQ